MKRRDFIKASALASSSLFVPNFLKAFELQNNLQTTKNVVIVKLAGGNDGLNTIVPFRNDLYYNLRPKIALKKEEYLPLTDELAINSGAKSLERLFKDGEMAVVNNVGYPNPNRSHFRASDIWQSGSTEEIISTGWVGRYMDSNCENAHEAIQVRGNTSIITKGKRMKGMTIDNIQKLYKATRQPFFKEMVSHPASTENKNLSYLYETLIETSSSASLLYKATAKKTSREEYPNEKFAKDLKLISQIIKSNVPTKVFYVTLSGFDTHVAQKQKHANLLKRYSEGIKAFTDDLKKNKLFNDTLILTFSEFGRRVAENGNRGTDHGSANNVFLFGGNLKKSGFLNDGPDLSHLDANGDLIYTTDFRNIYSTILDRWLHVDAKEVLGRKFNSLGFI